MRGLPLMPAVPTARSLFGSLQEERVQDADSVWRQQQAHQHHSCTLDECFHFYTKEEQVARLGLWVGHGAAGRKGAPAGWKGAIAGRKGALTVPVASFPAGPG